MTENNRFKSIMEDMGKRIRNGTVHIMDWAANLSLRMKLYAMAAGIALFFLFCLFYSIHTINQVQDHAIEYMEEELRSSREGAEIPQASKSSLKIVNAKLKSFKTQKILLFLLFGFLLLCMAIALSVLMANQAIQALRAIKGSVGRISKGDFSKEVDPETLELREDLGQLAGSLEKMRKDVSVLVGNVQNGVIGVTESVHGIHLHIKELNHEMEGVTSAAETVTASMKEAAGSAESIDGLAKGMETGIQDLSVKAKEGMERAKVLHLHAAQAKDEAEEDLELVRHNQDELKASLGRAFKDAKEVEQVLPLAESITSLMEQTNMLALNASIEAARAGEAGLRFADVVDEIRRISDESRGVVEQILWIIGEVDSAVGHIQKDTRRLFDFMDTKVMYGLRFLGEMADDYHAGAEEFGALASGAKHLSDEMTSSVEGILDASKTIGQAARDVSEGSAFIANQAVYAAARTKSMVNDFKNASQMARLLNEKAGQFIVAMEKEKKGKG